MAALLGGCRIARYELDESANGEAIEVKSGDRISIELDEHIKAGYRWMSECDDTDVSFARETLSPDEDAPVGTEGKVRIIIRVHRGFDGPAHVTLTNRQPWKGGKTARKIDILLHKTAEDKSPWRQLY